MSTRTLAIVAVCFGLITGGARAAAATELTLTRDGKPTATIVLGAEPTISAQFAAYELQYHVEKITGAKLGIESVSGVGDRVSESVRIFVGESEATRALGLKSADFAPREYMVAFRTNVIVLIGRDASLEVTAKLRNRRKVTYGDLYTYPTPLEANGSLYDSLRCATAAVGRLSSYIATNDIVAI